jgi:hypothetical protein
MKIEAPAIEASAFDHAAGYAICDDIADRRKQVEEPLDVEQGIRLRPVVE